jgi:hypothetical protein
LCFHRLFEVLKKLKETLQVHSFNEQETPQVNQKT